MDSSTRAKMALKNPPPWMEQILNGFPLKEDNDLVSLKELLSIKSWDRTNDTMNLIYEIIWRRGRQFFEGLSKESALYVCKNLHYEEFEEDQPVYLQDDVPKGYYFILKGRVSIHATYDTTASNDFRSERSECSDDDIFPYSSHSSIASKSLDGFGESSVESEDPFNELLTDSKDYKVAEISTTSNLKLRNMLNRENMYGEQLAQLTAGKGFGDSDFLKFTSKEEMRRSTSAISDGDPLEQGLEVTLIHPYNTLFLLTVPKDVFMVEMLQVKMQKSDYERKVMWLKGNPVLRQLHHITVLRLGYEMIGPKRYRQGQFYFHKGELRQFVYLVASGQVKLEQISRGHPEINDGRFTKIDVALCNPGDMFGLIEHVTQSDTFQHTAFCTTTTEVYLIKKDLFEQKVMSNHVVYQLLQKIVKERLDWENLRVQFLKSHKTIHTTLTSNIMEFSKFSINHDSILTSAQLKLRRQNMKKLAQLLRDSRSVLRNALVKENQKMYDVAKKSYEEVVDTCVQAMVIAETIGTQGRTHYNEAVERAEKARALRRRLSFTRMKKTGQKVKGVSRLKLALQKRRVVNSFTNTSDTPSQSAGDESEPFQSVSEPAFLPVLPGKKKAFGVQSDILKPTSASTSQLKSDFESIRNAFSESPRSSGLLKSSRTCRARRRHVKLSNNLKVLNDGFQERNHTESTPAPYKNLKTTEPRIPSPPQNQKLRKAKSLSPRKEGNHTESTPAPYQNLKSTQHRVASPPQNPKLRKAKSLSPRRVSYKNLTKI